MIFAGECDGEIYRLPEAERVEINQELYVPADDLTAVFPYSGEFPGLHKIYILSGGRSDIEKAIEESDVIFKGIVDEQILSADRSGARIKIYARSMAAVMLDNECPPMMYTNPSADIICSKHIEPFGVGFEIEGIKCRCGELAIAKGSSHYKAVEKFCSEFLGTVPRVGGDGICRFDTFGETEDILFDNKSGVEFESVEVCESRYSRISKVYVSGDNGYDTEVSDSESRELGITRERYLNLSSSETHTLSDADNILKNGRMKSLSVVLVCEGCLLNKIGCNAQVSVEGCEGEVFVVAQVKYTASSGGEKCRVKLMRTGNAGGKNAY